MDTAAPRRSARVLREMAAVPDLGSRWPAATRAGLTVLLPELVLALAGHPDKAPLVTLGAFAVLYGENRPYRIRWRVMLLGGGALVLAALLGGLLGQHLPAAGAAHWLPIVAVLALLGGVSVFVANALRLGPPGPYFVVLAAGAGAVVAGHGLAPTTIAMLAALGVAGSLMVGMAPALWARERPQTQAIAEAIRAVDEYAESSAEASAHRARGEAGGRIYHAWSVLHDAAQADSEHADLLWQLNQRLAGTGRVDDRPGDHDLQPPLPRPSMGHRLRAGLAWHGHATYTAARVLVAAAAAGALALVLGLGRPDWSMLAVVLVLQLGPDRFRGVVRGIHRALGTAIGLVLFGLIVALHPGELVVIVLLAGFTFLIELSVVSNYGLAATFITPVAMLMATAGGPIAPAVRDRLFETLIGVVLAIGALWLWPRSHRATLRLAHRRVLDGSARLLAVLHEQAPFASAAMTPRRDLQWQLIGADLAGTDAALDEPAWARAEWPRHQLISAAGYDLLATCWRTPYGERVAPEAIAALDAALLTLRAQ